MVCTSSDCLPASAKRQPQTLDVRRLARQAQSSTGATQRLCSHVALRWRLRLLPAKDLPDLHTEFGVRPRPGDLDRQDHAGALPPEQGIKGLQQQRLDSVGDLRELGLCAQMPMKIHLLLPQMD